MRILSSETGKGSCFLYSGTHVLASFNHLLLGSVKGSHLVGPVTALIRAVRAGGAGLEGLSDTQRWADGNTGCSPEYSAPCAHARLERLKHQ